MKDNSIWAFNDFDIQRDSFFNNFKLNATMYISQITARGTNNEIGKDNGLLWHLPIDTKWFFDTVKGHPIIMGRKSMEGLGAALPENINIVISRHPIDAEHHYAFDFTIWERIKIM